MIILILCILTLAIGTLGPVNKDTNIFNIQQSNNQRTNEQVCYDLFVTMLYPHVEKAIGDFYSEYMTDLPGEDPYSYKFISIEKEEELNYSFIVVLEVQPYIGPHLSVGRDRITFKISLDGVYIDNFEHLETYELPPNYQDAIKKPFPIVKP